MRHNQQQNLKTAIQALRLVSVDLAQAGYPELSEQAHRLANDLFFLRDTREKQAEKERENVDTEQ